jgi:hypothetical protein
MKQKQVSAEMVLKLPAWAQKHIQLINGLRFNAEQRLKEYLDGQTPSKVSLWAPLNDERKYIQDDRVYFELDNGRKICVNLSGDRIEVTGYGCGPLEITPHVSNQISVKLSDE